MVINSFLRNNCTKNLNMDEQLKLIPNLYAYNNPIRVYKPLKPIELIYSQVFYESQWSASKLHLSNFPNESKLSH